ncbi:MAG: hypothetical protein K6G55_00140 [Selenomonadaceae bacterium]|nr:hypothetical protein [Selenomonadaceae bacterium]
MDDSELEKPISSIFSISEKNDIPTDIYPDFEGTKIIIYLKKELYEIYYHFKDVNNGALRRYLTGVIVYPVLVEAVDIVLSSKSEDDDNSSNNNYNDLQWFRAIRLKINESANKFDNPYDEYATVLADYLLGGISLDSLKGFKNFIDNEVNSGEGQMTGGIN